MEPIHTIEKIKGVKYFDVKGLTHIAHHVDLVNKDSPKLVSQCCHKYKEFYSLYQLRDTLGMCRTCETIRINKEKEKNLNT